jgi:tetratricopeptide (TPR) repeat protein
MKKLLIFIIFTIAPFPVLGQGLPATFDLSNYGVKIDPEKRVIVVLSALEMARGRNAAGEEAKLINTPLSEAGKKFQTRLLADTAGLNEDLRSRISAFVAQYLKRHPKATDAEIVSPFIAMAFSLSPAPEMYDPSFTGDLPGELLDVLDFAPLAREFYRRSGINGKLDEYVKLYRAESDGTLRSSTREMVSELLDYMHTRPEVIYAEKVTVETQKTKSKSTVLQKIETREHERRFVVVPEMLAPAGSVVFLNIKDDYYVIVPPDKDVSYSEVRRAFLQFVVDPLVLKHAKEIAALTPSIKPLLEDRRKSGSNVSPDVYLAVSRSLIAAIDAREIEYAKLTAATRQARERILKVKTDAEKRQVSADLEKAKQQFADDAVLQLSDAYEHGAVLAFYFVDQLKGTEDSGFDLASSMKEIVATIDASKESKRLEENAEARKRAIAMREERKKRPIANEIAAENPVTSGLLEIEKTIEAKDYRKAAADLKQLLIANPSEPRIYYNIGRVASLSAEGMTDPEEQAKALLDAKVAYTNVINSSTAATDKALLSLTYVALARIYEFYNDPKYAIRLYEMAIKMDNVSGGAYFAAMAAKQRLLKTPQ